MKLNLKECKLRLVKCQIKSKQKMTFNISMLACVTDKHITVADWPPNYHKTSPNMMSTPNQLVNKNKQQIKISHGKLK